MSTYDQWAAAQERVVKIVKARFPNLTVEETIKLANEVVKAVLAAHS